MCVCVRWFAVLDELKHAEILLMFGATSGNTNPNYINIYASFLRVSKGLRFIHSLDLIIRPLAFYFISVCDPIKGTKGPSLK